MITQISAGPNKSYYNLQSVSAPIPLWADLSIFNKSQQFVSLYTLYWNNLYLFTRLSFTFSEISLKLSEQEYFRQEAICSPPADTIHRQAKVTVAKGIRHKKGLFSFSHHCCLFQIGWLPLASDQKLSFPPQCSPGIDFHDLFTTDSSYKQFVSKTRTITFSTSDITTSL